MFNEYVLMMIFSIYYGWWSIDIDELLLYIIYMKIWSEYFE